MYTFRISSISTREPVTVEEIKTFLRISHTNEDPLLLGYITAARQVAEQITKRSLINTEWELTLDGFKSKIIELPMGAPLTTSIADVVITYRKSTGDSTTLPSTCYVVDYRSEPAIIRLPYNGEWPDDVEDAPGSVHIIYRSGYSSLTTPTTIVPAAIRQWIQMRVGQMYEYREPMITDTIMSELKRDFVDGLLDPYRLPTA